ncbi:MAG: succinate dehydrogenase cytochrome b subunit [Actinomycetota bacterium]|nr:succinate dehydrogenase cytochrome b subunit [Actinomycetota bacterium]
MATTTSARSATTARRSTIGLKILMAGTGLVFVAYVLLHMYGNLKLLVGEEAFNTYAEHLRTIGEPMLPRSGLLWVIRVVLVLSLVGHAYAAFSLWSRAGTARRTKYAAVKTAMRTAWMRWGGVFILLFVVWHLLQFTILKFSVNPGEQGANVTQNPYALVVASFQVPWNTLIYVLAMVALAFHLSHGAFSAQQTLGWTMTAHAYRRAKMVGHALAAVVVVGFLIPPLAILFGLIK